MSGFYYKPIRGNFLGLSGGTVTGDTVFTQDVAVFGNFSANTIFSGNTDLETIIRSLALQSSSAHTYVQPGSNVTTGGTQMFPVINVVDSPSFASISADTIFSAGTINEIDGQSESKKSTTSHKRAWIKSLLKEGLSPVLKVIDEVSSGEWELWESYWIEQFRAWGFKLTNFTNGGEGVNKGNTPWNKGTKGLIKRNSGSSKKGSTIGKETRIKKGHRLSPGTEFKKGNEPHNKVGVLQFDLEGNFLEEYNSYTAAAESIGVTYGAIKNCILRKTYKCKGFLWKKMENKKELSA